MTTDINASILAIQQLIQDLPGDPFPRYGLAMAYNNAGRLSEAAACFAELGSLFPDYLPRYLMHGNVLVQLQRFNEAVELYNQGERLAIQQKQLSTANELRQAREDALLAQNESEE